MYITTNNFKTLSGLCNSNNKKQKTNLELTCFFAGCSAAPVVG